MATQLPDHAGLVQYRRARQSGTFVGIYRSLEAGIESDPDLPWATVCEPHAGVVCHRTLELARRFAPVPLDWCPTCQNGGVDPADSYLMDLQERTAA